MGQEQLNDVADVQHLVRQGVHDIALTVDTPVLCIHRGRRLTKDGEPVHHAQAARYPNKEREPYFEGDYKDTYDGDHYVIAPGYFTAPHGAALHFQRRAVVPGSRNPETQTQTSFIAIIGVVEAKPGGGMKVLRAVDPEEDWSPFTDEECAEYEVAFEAINRAAMVAPIDEQTQLVDINDVRSGKFVPGKTSRVTGGTGGTRPSRRAPQQEATDARVRQRKPARENAAVQEAAQGRKAGAGAGDED